MGSTSWTQHGKGRFLRENDGWDFIEVVTVRFPAITATDKFGVYYSRFKIEEFEDEIESGLDYLRRDYERVHGKLPETVQETYFAAVEGWSVWSITGFCELHDRQETDDFLRHFLRISLETLDF